MSNNSNESWAMVSGTRVCAVATMSADHPQLLAQASLGVRCKGGGCDTRPHLHMSFIHIANHNSQVCPYVMGIQHTSSPNVEINFAICIVFIIY
jgi:hypothetical protein